LVAPPILEAAQNTAASSSARGEFNRSTRPTADGAVCRIPSSPSTLAKLTLLANRPIDVLDRAPKSRNSNDKVAPQACL
jgi:hypothetical protein